MESSGSDFNKDDESVSSLYPALWTRSKPDKVQTFYFRVGLGDVSGDDCGMITGAAMCPSGDHPLHLFRNWCGAPACPVCYEYYLSKAGHRCEDKLHGMKKALLKSGYKVGKVRHVVWSPVQGDWGPDRFRDGGKAFREAFKRTLKARTHYYGGAFILHCERKKHTDGTECEEKRCSKKHIWVWGPHIHYVGWGYFDNSGEVHKRTGWVYKVIEDRGPRDVYLTVRYQLSHATIFPAQGRQMLVRYIGMATWGRKEKIGTHREHLTCRVCGEDLRRVGDYNGHLDLSIDLGPCVVRKAEYRYLIRVRGRKKRIEQHRFGLDLHEGNT